MVTVQEIAERFRGSSISLDHLDDTSFICSGKNAVVPILRHMTEEEYAGIMEAFQPKFQEVLPVFLLDEENYFRRAWTEKKDLCKQTLGEYAEWKKQNARLLSPVELDAKKNHGEVTYVDDTSITVFTFRPMIYNYAHIRNPHQFQRASTLRYAPTGVRKCYREVLLLNGQLKDAGEVISQAEFNIGQPLLVD